MNNAIVNIYRSSGEWCYAAFLGREYDSSGSLESDSECDSIAEVLRMLPGATVRRVADVDSVIEK